MNATRLPCAPGRGIPSAWNCEKPYFCTKIDLQLHFRGKHTKEYLRMVSALTGKPAGKSVQLGRHNHLKDNLDITGMYVFKNQMIKFDIKLMQVKSEQIQNAFLPHHCRLTITAN